MRATIEYFAVAREELGAGGGSPEGLDAAAERLRQLAYEFARQVRETVEKEVAP